MPRVKYFFQTEIYRTVSFFWLFILKRYSLEKENVENILYSRKKKQKNQQKKPDKYLLKQFKKMCDFQMSFLRQLSSSKSSLAKESLLSLAHSVLGEGIGLEKFLTFHC